MITIHQKNKTDFRNLGLGALFPSLCTVKEELNGLFELELEHPYDEYGKWKSIENDRILFADTPRGKQPFRIYRVNPSLAGIKVNARHIFYDLLDNFIVNLRTSGTASGVLNALKSQLSFPMPFVFDTDMTISGSLSIEKQNPIQALMGTDESKDSFVKVFGGELLRDGFEVSMNLSIGKDRGVQIRYRKNLVGLEVDEDISGVATKIYPIGKEGLTLPEQFVNSSHINDYLYPKIITHEDTECETQAELRASARKLIEDGIDIPKVNIKVNFQLLARTEEYKHFAILEEVQLGDVVSVINEKMNFRKKAKVISYQWDCLLNQYISVELGDFVADITGSITTGEKAISTANSASTSAKQVLGLISGNITIKNNFLYIALDNADYTIAMKLFRWGINGLQYSSNGLNGTWKTVIGTDGVVVTA